MICLIARRGLSMTGGGRQPARRADRGLYLDPHSVEDGEQRPVLMPERPIHARLMVRASQSRRWGAGNRLTRCLDKAMKLVAAYRLPVVMFLSHVHCPNAVNQADLLPVLTAVQGEAASPPAFGAILLLAAQDVVLSKIQLGLAPCSR